MHVRQDSSLLLLLPPLVPPPPPRWQARAHFCYYTYYLESFAECDCLSVLAAEDETRSEMQIASDITDRQATDEMET
jgi:hypothetical protein